MSEVKNTAELKQSFVDHLVELRGCLVKAFIGWAVGAIIAYILSPKIIQVFLYPLFKAIPREHIIYFRTFPEVFSTYLKLGIIVGFIIGSPYILYQLWNFIAPGLYPHEQKWVKLTVFLTCFSFLIGDLVAYFLFLPYLLKFLYSFGERFLVFKPFLTEYINFILKFFVFAGVIFQLPAFMILLAKLELVGLEEFSKFRPYAIILSFVIAAVVTGGADPLTQILIALPLTLLYEVGIILVRLVQIKSKGGKP
ncbi:MAG: twin-arginine translocase subunit TatC [Thermodesulfobacteria bacterium]|nr:twin-arginine translocase subunit TatC [Thermodesulfobacteriota bacterium]